jgi:RNA polymerase sigma-70 factor (ECF subfamily)
MTAHATDTFESDELRWAALMVSAQAGHEADYRLLLTEMSEVINRYLRSRFGHHHFVEDCVQETLVAIHQARHTYDACRLFRPWMFAIVRHKAIDTLRRQRSHQNTLERHREYLLVNSDVAGSVHSDHSMVQGRLLAALSPQYREAITLTKIYGFSIAEAAEQLSISQGSLKVRIHRGIARLKRMVEADD